MLESALTSDWQEYTLTSIRRYESRLDQIADVLGEVSTWIDLCEEEVQILMKHVREHLADGVHMRRKDFESLVESTRKVLRERGMEFRKLIDDFLSQEKLMIVLMKKMVRYCRADDIREFATLKERMLISRRSRQEQICALLQDIRLDQMEISMTLEALLKKRTSITVLDFKRALRELEISRPMRAQSGGHLWNDFRKAWSAVSEEMAGFSSLSCSGAQGEEESLMIA